MIVTYLNLIPYPKYFYIWRMDLEDQDWGPGYLHKTDTLAFLMHF